MFQMFDLDGFLDEQVTALRSRQQPKDELPKVTRELKRVGQEQHARERSERALNPKMKYRTSTEEIWTPKGVK